jgi:hypothetical protein
MIFLITEILNKRLRKLRGAKIKGVAFIPALESASLNEHATILTTKFATLISNR